MVQRKKSRRQTKRLPRELEALHLDAAGVDIGARWITAAVGKGRDDEGRDVRTFSSFVPSLHELVNWLKRCGIRSVAMESTGVYWIPLYELLESAGIEACLVDARKVKNVSGRKTDVCDAEWLQQLHTFGLLERAFRPDGQICKLRCYLRQRKMLVESAARHIHHMQKALSQMGLKLQHVVRDITGDTGLAILRAIARGETDPKKLAKFRNFRCRNDEKTIADALVGNYRQEHVFALCQAIELYDVYQDKIIDCDKMIEVQLTTIDSRAKSPFPVDSKKYRPKGNAPRFEVHKHLFRITGVDLTAVTGLDAYSVLQLVAETGMDMGRWKSHKHFTSWLALSPNTRISGGKVLRRSTKRTSSRAATLFRLAARAVSNSQSALGAFYRRIRARHGAPKAITATARKIAVIYYQMLKNGTQFVEKGQEYYEEQYAQRMLSNLNRRAHKLGFDLVPSNG